MRHISKHFTSLDTLRKEIIYLLHLLNIHGQCAQRPVTTDQKFVHIYIVFFNTNIYHVLSEREKGQSM